MTSVRFARETWNLSETLLMLAIARACSPSIAPEFLSYGGRKLRDTHQCLRNSKQPGRKSINFSKMTDIDGNRGKTWHFFGYVLNCDFKRGLKLV